MRRLTSLLALAIALAVPTAARAGTLTTSLACVQQGTGLQLSGSGFSPDISLRLAITDDGGGTVYPDDSGAFSDYDLSAPAYASVVPKTLTITATDQVDATRSATTQFQVVQYGSNFPVGGRPGAMTAWRFAGFPAGTAIYGHFRYRNKLVRTYRFGTSSGPCGTLAVKAKRLPVTRPRHTGGWYVQVDARPAFSFNTRPEYDRSFAVR